MSNKRKFIRETSHLGATGDFPRGKLNAGDEGGVRLAVYEDDGTVIVDFGSPVTWLGLPPEEARALAQYLLKYADKLTT